MAGNKFAVPPIKTEEIYTMLPTGTDSKVTVQQTKTVSRKNVSDGKRTSQDQVQAFALENSLQAIAFYAQILNDPTQSTKDRLAAADRLLDRAVGKAQQVATVHGTSTQVSVTPQDFLEALKSRQTTIDVTPKDD